MGVRVRQKVKGKGKPWWVFVSHKGERTSRKVGSKKAAEKVASTIQAKLQLGEFGFEDKKPAPSFKDHAKLWLALPHDWKESTRENYLNNLNNHILPDFGKIPVNEIKRKDLEILSYRSILHHLAGFLEKIAPKKTFVKIVVASNSNMNEIQKAFDTVNKVKSILLISIGFSINCRMCKFINSISWSESL